MRRTSKRS